MEILNEIITTSPSFNKTEMVGAPMNGFLAVSMAAEAGLAFFHDTTFNLQFKKILNAWNTFLKSGDSLDSLDIEDPEKASTRGFFPRLTITAGTRPWTADSCAHGCNQVRISSSILICTGMIEASTCVIEPGSFIVEEGSTPVRVKRGAEIFLFEFGGSMHMMIFLRNRVRLEKCAVNAVRDRNDPDPTPAGGVIATATSRSGRLTGRDSILDHFYRVGFDLYGGRGGELYIVMGAAAAEGAIRSTNVTSFCTFNRVINDRTPEIRN